MSEIKVRGLKEKQINAINYISKIKGFSSRESYIRHLIEKDLNENIHNNSHLKYTQLVEQLLEYVKYSNEIIKENNDLLLFLAQKS